MSVNEREDRGLEKEWLRFDEAAKVSGLGRTKLYEYCSKKYIRTAKVGRSRIINRKSLTEFMNRHVS